MSYTQDLYFFHDDNSSFVDYTKESRHFLRDDFSISFTAIEDSIYFGLYKPFNQVYAEIVTAASGVSLAASYFNGTSFVGFDINDETSGFSRSGFLKWDRALENWTASEINNETKYWIKLDADGDFTVVLRALNMVFSDDIALQSEMININDFRQLSAASFINYHVSSRDEIIQKLRNSGKIKRTENEDQYQDITQWDILKPSQLYVASKYLTLAKIMFDVSSETDDKYYQRYNDFMDEFGEAFRLYLLNIDTDNDGVQDTHEANRIRSVSIAKV